MSRLTIRDGFWLAALLSALLMWLIDHENLSHNQSEQLKAAKEAWAAAAEKDATEVREKIGYIMQRMAEKFPNAEVEE